MIELRAIRIDVLHDRFEFRIKSPNKPLVTAQSVREAVGILEGLGVKDAEHLVEHSMTGANSILPTPTNLALSAK